MTATNLPIPKTPFTSIRAIIGGEMVDAVDARSLHGWLGVGRDFSNWFLSRVAEALFIEGSDFDLCSPNLASKTGNARGGSNRKDYVLTIDAAMHVAMLERTEIGRAVRQDAIEWKKRGKAAQRSQELTPEFAMELATRWQAERNARLEAESREKVMNERAAEEFSKRITAEARVVQFEGRISDITFEECFTQMYSAGHFVGLCPLYEDNCKNVTSFVKWLRHEFITNGGLEVNGHERFNKRGCIYEKPQTRDEKDRRAAKVYKLTEKGVRAVEKILDNSRKNELLYPDNRTKILKFRNHNK